MKNKMIARTMIAVMLAASLPAIAQDRGYRDDRSQERSYRDDRAQEQRREYRQDVRNEQREERHEARREYRDNQRDARRDYRDDRRDDRGDYRHGNRGAGPRHDLYSGQRLPSNYQNRQYVVDNWRSHRLSAPPRGHHWVQVGNDYVLAAIATGVIASVFLGN
jgi:Ni/Co efflux regulator RcnB